MDDRARIEAAFDPEFFRQAGRRLVDRLADHLQRLLARDEDIVLPWLPPEEARARYRDPESFGSAEAFFESLLRDSIRLHHPRYAGHQINPPAPIAALAGLLADMLNNGMGVYEMGAAGVAVEDAVISRLAERLGLGPAAGGVMTSGGTLGNLTALLAARSSRAHPCPVRASGERRFAILASDQAHYCVQRAVHVMGWGEEGLIRIPCDERFRMRTELLEDAVASARGAGVEPIAIVGSACSTSTGAFDDLAAIGAACRRHGLWFHVDGAHGAAAIFSPTHRELLRGVELADSLVVDFHKMMLSPALATGLLFRRAADQYAAFAHQAEYLYADQHQQEWFNLAKRTFECTKSMMAAKAYALLTEHGEPLLRAAVDRLFELASQFADLLQRRKGWELAVRPQGNIVCFRFRGDRLEAGDDALGRWNQTLRQRVIEAGRCYLVQTNLHGSTWLRTTIANPLTTLDDLVQLLEEVERAAAETGD